MLVRARMNTILHLEPGLSTTPDLPLSFINMLDTTHAAVIIKVNSAEILNVTKSLGQM